MFYEHLESLVVSTIDKIEYTTISEEKMKIFQLLLF